MTIFFIKNIYLKLISLGITPQMEDNKKFAIQISKFDGIASFLTFLFYFIYNSNSSKSVISYSHLIEAILCVYGINLIRIKKYDAGRILIYIVGLAGTFLTIDSVAPRSGYEFYYFATIIVPFVTFTPEEMNKSIILALSGLLVFLIQQTIGPGIFSDITLVSNTDRVVNISILFVYIIALFSISRWQVNRAHKKIKSQQIELIHTSNMAALAEMSGGIAHEINNPLQVLSTHISLMKKQLNGIKETPDRVLKSLEQMDETVTRISKLVKSLKNLSRNVESENLSTFLLSSVFEDLLSVSSQKLKHLNIDLKIQGDTNIKVHGQIVPLSQVFINLINNAIDAIGNHDNKWIKIDIFNNDGNKNIITLTDSGLGIPKDVTQKIMLPFFTTKDPGKGTGLGLSISTSLIEKMGGRLYYDISSFNTKFIIELPKA